MMLWAAALHVASAAVGAKPEVVMVVLVDDLGYADIQPNGEWSPTPYLGTLAAAGVALTHMHGYKVCSPSRRSLLSGRFPVHISGQQAPVCSNFLPLQMTLLSGKLKQAGFTTHFVGKGHLGYLTTDHLPINRGFDTHVGYLSGDANYAHGQQVMCDVPNLYNLPDQSWMGRWPPRSPPDPCHLDLWRGNGTAAATDREGLLYSTDMYAAETVGLIQRKQPGVPMFVWLAWQAVHGPWTLPPGDPATRLLQPGDRGYANYCSSDPLPVPDPDPDGLGRTQTMRCQFGSMLKVLDGAMASMTAALRARGLWDDTLLFVMSDNGGVGPGNNWPHRGQKNTAWQGGTNVAAYAMGGFIPTAARGSRFETTLHFADVYPTVCGLAGVDPTDTVVLNGAPRPIDGLDFWPLLLNSTTGSGTWGTATHQIHEFLPTTEDSIIWVGRWKLITGSVTRGGAYWFPDGGRGPNNSIIPAEPASWPCVNATAPVGSCLLCSPEHPCLFDLANDPSERTNLAVQHPETVAMLAKQLAAANAGRYVDGTMTAAELANYDCVPDKERSKYPRRWWGNFTGPCCTARAGSAWTVSPVVGSTV